MKKQGKTGAAREAQLKVDEARYAAEHAQDELSELIAMYEADEFAEMTKELILKRGRRNLEVAGRELEIQSERLEVGRLTRERKHAAAKGAVAEARQGVEAAKRGLRKSELEGSISLLEAQSTIDGLRDELEALTR